MAKFTFKKATKEQAKARIALVGPSGSGKTYTGLQAAAELGDRIAVIDTERGSASKYAGIFEFDVLELDTFEPDTYVEAIEAAEQAGYDVLIIDSLSHAWMGKGGALEQVDKAARRSPSKNTFNAWRDVTPMHNRLVEALVGCSCHLIVTMRTKTEYVVEDNGKGKSAPRKVGLAPIQRDGLEYEFDVLAEIDLDHFLNVSKTRCPTLDSLSLQKAGDELGRRIKEWLQDGEKPKTKPVAPTVAPGDYVATEGSVNGKKVADIPAGTLERIVASPKASSRLKHEAKRWLEHLNSEPEHDAETGELENTEEMKEAANG